MLQISVYVVPGWLPTPELFMRVKLTPAPSLVWDIEQNDICIFAEHMVQGSNFIHEKNSQ